ncbi:MAG: hypothetical protein ABEJ31_14640 [Haloarculaceae archaeon]
MAPQILAFALVLTGLVLLSSGIFAYRAGVVTFGFLVGIAVGFALTGALGQTGLTQLGTVLTLGIAGLLLAGSLFVAVVVVPGAVTGFAIAFVLTGVDPTPVSNLLNPFLVVGTILGVVAAIMLKEAVVVVVSATWGALLVWAGVATDGIVRSLAALQVPTPPTWVYALGIFGAVVQGASWYVTRRYDDDELRAAILGGAGRLRDRVTGRVRGRDPNDPF